MLGQTVANRYKLNEELLSDSLSRPLEVQLRFKRAAEQTSKLNHPNLLKTIEVAESDNKLYLVSEYLHRHQGAA